MKFWDFIVRLFAAGQASSEEWTSADGSTTTNTIDASRPDYGPLWNFYCREKLPGACISKSINSVSLPELDQKVRNGCRQYYEQRTDVDNDTLQLVEQCHDDLQHIILQLSEEDRWYFGPMVPLTGDLIYEQRMKRRYEQQLLDAGISPALMAIFKRAAAHEIFARHTEPAPIAKEIQQEIERQFETDETWSFTPLWGGYHRIVGCWNQNGEVSFIDCTGEGTGLGAEDTEIRTIARSEQGLLFWFFARLYEFARSDYDDEWESELRKAADSVEFKHLDDLLTFMGEHQFDYELWYERSLAIN